MLHDFLLAQADREVLVPPLGPAGQVHHVAYGIAEIDVDVDFALAVEAGIELVGGRGAQRGVYRVEDEEVHLAGAVASAGVPEQPTGGLALHPGDQGGIGHVAPELGREAAREHLLIREAVRVREHLRQRRLIRQAVAHPDGRTSRGAIVHTVPCVQRIPDEKGLPVVDAEHRGAGVFGLRKKKPPVTRSLA